MGGVEYRSLLHTQSSEVIDVKEATIVDRFRSGTPPTQAIRLDCQQRVEAAEALASGAVDDL